MGLIMQEGKFVNRDEVVLIDTPSSTDTWHPVPHIDVIEAVTKVVRAHEWEIVGEKFGLAREGQKMFGVMEISRSSSPEWHRCIGIRNSHDRTLAIGRAAGWPKSFIVPTFRESCEKITAGMRSTSRQSHAWYLRGRKTRRKKAHGVFHQCAKMVKTCAIGN